MTKTILFMLGLSALAGSPRRVQGQTAADSQAVRTVVTQYHEALTRGDSSTALQLLADDAVILEAGGIESRAEYRAHHLQADIRFAMAVPSTPGPLLVAFSGNTAWVSSTSETVGTFDGRAINSAGAELMVLTRSVDGWKIRAIHWSSRRRTTG